MHVRCAQAFGILCWGPIQFLCSYPLEEPSPSDLLFDMDTISEALRSSGHDTSRLSAPFIPQPLGLGNSTNSYHSRTQIKHLIPGCAQENGLESLWLCMWFTRTWTGAGSEIDVCITSAAARKQEFLVRIQQKNYSSDRNPFFVLGNLGVNHLAIKNKFCVTDMIFFTNSFLPVELLQKPHPVHVTPVQVISIECTFCRKTFTPNW